MRRRLRTTLLVAIAAVLLLFGVFLARESGRCFPAAATAAVPWPAAPAGSAIKHVAAGGIDFAYVEAGSGPLVLLLHGYPETPIVWAKAMTALASAGYHAVAPYMRGYPPSSAPADSDYSIRALGGDALALVAALGAERATIVGHDWGASAAYAAAVRAPQAVEKLVAVSIPHPIALAGDPTVLWKASHFLEYQIPGAVWWLNSKSLCHIDSIYARWAPGWTPPAAVLDAVKASLRSDSGFRNAFGYYWSFFARPASQPDDLSPQSRIGVPTLVITGADDAAVDIARFAKASAGFTGPYQFVALAHAGHFPEVEQAEAFDAALLAFLGPPRQ
jgi:pimeloyl-ACP methyl ester carboxylesterase